MGKLRLWDVRWPTWGQRSWQVAELEFESRSIWILKPIFFTINTTPLILCCQCGGDSTLIKKVPVKRSLYHHHHSSANTFPPLMCLEPMHAVQWGSPLQWVSASCRWSPQPQAHRSSWSLLGGWEKSCLRWNMMLIRPTQLGFSNIFPLTTWYEEARLGRDPFVQLKETLGVRVSCYQTPEQWLLNVMCGLRRFLATVWL